MCERSDFKGSRSSLAVRALANPTLDVKHLVFPWCVGKVPCFEPAEPAVAAAAWPESPMAAGAAVEEQHL